LDLQQLIGAEADLVAAHAEDAGVAGAEHLDARSAAEPELLEAMDVIGVSGDAADASPLAGLEFFQGDGAGMVHGGRYADPPWEGDFRLILSLNIDCEL